MAQRAIGCHRRQRRFYRPRNHSDGLPSADEPPLPLNQAGEDQRRTTNEQNYGAVATGVLQYTTDVLFTDLWLRPALAPRDRSLITVSALVASGQTAQIPFTSAAPWTAGLPRKRPRKC